MDGFVEVLKNLGVICLGMAPVGIGYLWLDCNWDLKQFARALCKFLVAMVGVIIAAMIMVTAAWIGVSVFEAPALGLSSTEAY